MLVACKQGDVSGYQFSNFHTYQRLRSAPNQKRREYEKEENEISPRLFDSEIKAIADEKDMRRAKRRKAR
jgi:hypothetical protein